MEKIMIIEDEADIREELALLLANAGYRTLAPEDFSDITGEIAKEAPDLILLDIGLPDTDGYRLCRKIREQSDLPVIFVTSRNTSLDELRALSLGGDDFIAKPYNVPVLIARIKAMLRRNGDRYNSESLTVKGLTLEPRKGTMRCGGHTCDLTKNELKILCCLMERQGEIVSRAELIEYLWDNEIYIDDNTLSVNMTRVRGKLNALGLDDYISTKRGMGYKC